MPTIQGVDFEERELEFLAIQNNTNVDRVVADLSGQPTPSLINFKKALQQALANHLLIQEEDLAKQAYTPPKEEPGHNSQRSTYNTGSSTDTNSRLQKIVQGAQVALFVVLAKAKLAANNFGDRWFGGKGRPPIQTKLFSFNPLAESFFNPIRNILVGGLGYMWLNGVVKSSSSGVKSVLEETNAFSSRSSLNAVQIAAMLLFLELMSDIKAIAKKIKEGKYGEAGTKAVWDMIQNTLYFFTIYEFNKPWQILVATLFNILIIEKILEEKLFKDSFATHARGWKLRMEPYFLMIMSLILSTNKTLNELSLANASRFETKDLIAVSQKKVAQLDMDLDPEQITHIHQHPMQLADGKYLYIVETAEKNGLLIDEGVKVFRVISKFPITSKDMFGLMTLQYYYLGSYTPPANASEILQLTGNIDAYGKTLIVEAKWAK